MAELKQLEPRARFSGETSSLSEVTHHTQTASSSACIKGHSPRNFWENLPDSTHDLGETSHRDQALTCFSGELCCFVESPATPNVFPKVADVSVPLKRQSP